MPCNVVPFGGGFAMICGRGRMPGRCIGCDATPMNLLLSVWAFACFLTWCVDTKPAPPPPPVGVERALEAP